MWIVWMLIGMWIGTGAGFVLAALFHASADKDYPRASDAYTDPPLCMHCFSRPAVCFGPYRADNSPLCNECAQRLGCVEQGK